MWFRVDDHLTWHDKALAAGNASLGVWVRAGSWCGGQLSDGFVPLDLARSLGTSRELSRLVSSGLWLPVEGGYQFHDWSAFNPLRAEVEARRAADAKRKKRWRDQQDGDGDDPED